MADVYCIMDGGISLTITPLLSLGADQEEKLTLRANQTTGRVVLVHLDKMCSLSDQQLLVNQLKSIPSDCRNVFPNPWEPTAVWTSP